MKQDITRSCVKCEKCGIYYFEEMGETCRCPPPKTNDEINDELLSKWQKGEVTL